MRGVKGRVAHAWGDVDSGDFHNETGSCGD